MIKYFVSLLCLIGIEFSILLLQESVVVFALGNVFGRIAGLGVLVVDQAQLATLLTGRDAIEANVKLGAVWGVRVLGVRIGQAERVFGAHVGALESVLQGMVVGWDERKLINLKAKVKLHDQITSFAVGPLGLRGPVADAAELVEPQAGRAGVLLGHALDAGIEDIAHTGVGVRVESVQSGAKIVGPLGGFYKINLKMNIEKRKFPIAHCTSHSR
jgi:hypothetical protein